LAVKDNIDVAGLPTGAGHPHWLATHAPAGRDAQAVANLRAAGAVVVGKAHTDELAYSLAGTNAHYGTPVNPAAPGHIPGGSSSGPASAVAAGQADLGLGTDTAGSIRVPASFTGLYSLRPTWARVSRDGIVPLAPSFDVPGLLTRDLELLRAAAAALLTGTPAAASAARVLLPGDLWAAGGLPELRPALDLLGAALPVNTAPLFGDPGPAWDQVGRAFSTVQASEVWLAHGQWIQEEKPVFGPGVTSRLTMAAGLTHAEVARAGGVLRAARDLLMHRLADGTVLVIPSAPGPPFALRGASPGRAALLRFTCLASLLGAPAISVPVASRAGLPLGLSLVGEPGQDEALLAVARLLT
jgi:amidase